MEPDKLKHFFEVSLSLLCTADAATTTFVDLNPAWERTLGWSLDELRSRPFTAFIHPDDLAPTFAVITEMVDQGRDAVNFENRYRHKNGTWVWLSWYGVVKDGTFYSAAQPITAYKHALEALSQANAELSHFAYAASHDLQEPLRAITAHLEFVDPAAFDPETRRSLAFVRAGGQRMQQLLDGLLAYARIDSSPREPSHVPMTRPLHAAIDGLHRAIQESGASVDISGTWPTLNVDEVQVVSLFQNLLANAIKYRKPGSAPRIAVAAEPDGEGFTFRVRDDGVGFTAANPERAFQLFQRLHRGSAYEGMGVGLALVKRIAIRHGGRVGIESTVDVGTAVWVWLPTVEAAP